MKREDYEKGYRAAVAQTARMIRSTDWDSRTKKRLGALVRLMASFSGQGARPQTGGEKP